MTSTITPKFLIIALMFVSTTWSLSAQETAEFEMPLYFEDARGNKDTLIIGFDEMGSFYQNRFETPVLKHPFDSVFEVRGSSSRDYWLGIRTPLYFTKKVIVKKNLPPAHIPGLCWYVDYIVIFIQNRYPPFTMRWDPEMFSNEPCLIATYMSWDRSDVLQPPWWGYYDRVLCMAKDSSEIKLHLKTYIDWGNYFIDDWYGEPIDTIFGFELVMQTRRPGLAPCSEPVSVSPFVNSQDIKVFPNPGTDEVSIEVFGGLEALGGYDRVVVYDVNGLQIFTQTIQSQNNQTRHIINTSSLPGGMYLISLETDQGVILGTQRWVKQE